MARIGIVLLTLLALTGCGRSEGATFLAGDLHSAKVLDASLPDGVNTQALGAIINYVDAINIGMRTGNGLAIRMSAQSGCGCLAIADNFEAIYKEANLVGGSYRITEIAPVTNTPIVIKLKVMVAMSATTHILRKSGAREIWPASEINTVFTLKPVAGTWSIVASA
jgi:hypothetical protein